LQTCGPVFKDRVLATLQIFLRLPCLPTTVFRKCLFTTTVFSILQTCRIKFPKVILFKTNSNYVLTKILKGIELPSGSEEEVEIRGCSIAAVDAVYRELVKRGCADHNLINPILIDQWLWTERRNIASQVENLGYHKTRTIFY